MLVTENEDVRKMEEAAVSRGVSMEQLMEKAGTKTAAVAAKLIAEKKLKKVCVLCGSGNNGGDGYVIARLLSVMSEVTVIMATGEPKSTLARMNFELLPDNVEVFDYASRLYECIGVIRETEMIIDAVYGIGFRDGLNADLTDLMSFCQENTKAVRIAVDIPTGIVCDTGEIINGCFDADYTVTFTTLKPAHVLYPASDHCGEIIVEDVGVPSVVKKHTMFLMKTTDEFVEEHPLSMGKKSDHKGSRGTLAAVCGSYGMAGAAVMAGKAALRSGVGLVKMALPKGIYPIAASHLCEPVFCVLRQSEDGKIDIDEYGKLLTLLTEESDAALIGCGLGISQNIRSLVALLVDSAVKPLVLDADGINAIASNINVLKRAKAPIILTPHPAEMGRLTGTDAHTVQLDRYGCAAGFAAEFGVTVVLKGANTLIATPDGKTYVNLTGNNGMAKGGSGDILAGMMASFLAQGMSTEEAAVNAVYYHGLAGDRCAEKYHQRSMLPTDMIEELKYWF